MRMLLQVTEALVGAAASADRHGRDRPLTQPCSLENGAAFSTGDFVAQGAPSPQPSPEGRGGYPSRHSAVLASASSGSVARQAVVWVETALSSKPNRRGRTRRVGLRWRSTQPTHRSAPSRGKRRSLFHVEVGANGALTPTLSRRERGLLEQAFVSSAPGQIAIGRRDRTSSSESRPWAAPTR